MGKPGAAPIEAKPGAATAEAKPGTVTAEAKPGAAPSTTTASHDHLDARPRPAARAEPPEAAAKLDDAERLLGAGSYQDAIQRARQSLVAGDTPRAHRVITTAYCGLHDLGGANAALHKVAAADRRQVLARCRQLGLDL